MVHHDYSLHPGKSASGVLWCSKGTPYATRDILSPHPFRWYMVVKKKNIKSFLTQGFLNLQVASAQLKHDTSHPFLDHFCVQLSKAKLLLYSLGKQYPVKLKHNITMNICLCI